MTQILHLGVEDIPYVTTESPANSAKRIRAARQGRQPIRPAQAPGLVTTGDVAEELEARYHVIEIFFTLHEQQIADLFAQSLSDSIDDLLAGAPLAKDPYGGAKSEMIKLFRRFIESGEMEKLGYPGVPTRAALEGVNHRLKTTKGARRPSFRDTGLYEASFAAWIDGGT
jgi:hypothetical protein